MGFRYMPTIESMEPWPGFEKAELPGGPEARRWEARGEGVALAKDHAEGLRRIGAELGVEWTVEAKPPPAARL